MQIIEWHDRLAFQRAGSSVCHRYLLRLHRFCFFSFSSSFQPRSLPLPEPPPLVSAIGGCMMSLAPAAYRNIAACGIRTEQGIWKPLSLGKHFLLFSCLRTAFQKMNQVAPFGRPKREWRCFQ